MLENHAIYAVFCTWGSKNTINTDTFEPKGAKNAIHTNFFARCAKNHGIYSVFCTWPFKNIGISTVFATFHVVVFQHKNCKNTVFYSVLHLEFCKKLLQKWSKNRPRRPPFPTRDFLANFPGFLMNF